MSRKTPLLLASVATMLTLSAPSAHAQPEAASPDAVTTWNSIATSTLALIPGPASGAPPALQINMGMTQGAVYDAVNAITPKHYRPYLLDRRFSAQASPEAAVATAAYRVLTHIISTVPQGIDFPNQGALLSSLDGQYESAMSAIADSPFKTQGIAAGNAAAEAMIAARQDDGRFGPSPYVFNPDPGHWQPQTATGATVLDPTAWVGGVRPFLMERSNQFQTDGPLDITSPQYAAELDEVKAIGGDGATTPTIRTAEQTQRARFWQSAGGPALLWNGSARGLVLDSAHDVDVLEAARLFAMMNLSAADAAINCWNDKYHFDFWRPFQAIRRAESDGNDATAADPTWTPLLPAPYPEHPSGHLCLDGAHLRSLQIFFDTDLMDFGVTSSTGATRFFERFSQPLEEIVEARIWAGLHFRTGDIQGRDLGINVADYGAEHYFQPVGRR